MTVVLELKPEIEEALRKKARLTGMKSISTSKN